MRRSGWITTHIVAWCGATGCDWGIRIESPTPDEMSTVIKKAKAHTREPGHHTAVERGASQAFDAPPAP